MCEMGFKHKSKYDRHLGTARHQALAAVQFGIESQSEMTREQLLDDTHGTNMEIIVSPAPEVSLPMISALFGCVCTCMPVHPLPFH